MGVYTKGILGGFSGKVGTVVGVTWRGKEVMRSLPTPSNHVASPAQLKQRMRFTTVIQFLSPMRAIVGKYFGHVHDAKSPMNQAVGYHLQNALVLNGEVYEIKYPEVVISKGDLPGLQSPTADLVGGTEVKVNWQDNSDQGIAEANDGLYVVAYEPQGKLYEMFFAAANRDDESVNLTMPNYFSGQRIQLWGTFVTADEKTPATSTYLGEISLE